MFTLDYSDAIILYYIIIAKIIPAFITYFADKYFNIKIQFKSLSVLNANIQNIIIKWSCYEVLIGEIGLNSKYLDRDCKKPLCIDIENVKFQKIHSNDSNNNNCDVAKSNLEEHFKVKQAKEPNNSNHNNKHAQESRNFLANSLSEILPSTIMMTLKFLQVRVKNFSTTLLNKDKGPLGTISIPNIELLFDGCLVRDERNLFITLVLQHIKLKFIAYNKQNPSRKPQQACLAEIIFDVTLEIHVVYAKRQIFVEKKLVCFKNTQVIFNGGLFDIIEHFMLHSKRGGNDVTKIEENCKDMKVSGNRQKLITKLTPDVMIVDIQQVEVKSLNKQSSFHYHLLLQHVLVKCKFKMERSVKVKISNLRIYTPIHEVLHLRKFLIDEKFERDNLIKSSVIIDNLDATYNHEDIFGWFHKIFTAGMKSSRKEIIIKAIATMNRNISEFYHSQVVMDFFNQVIITGTLECRNVVIILELDEEISSINATKIRIILNQCEEFRENFYENYTMDLLFKNRVWNIDFLTEGNLCWFMDSKFPHLLNSKTNDDGNKKTFVRGSAFYLGETFARVCSHRDDFKLNVSIKSLHTEYSNKFTSFTVQSLKSIKAYDKLFKQLKSKEEKSDDIEKLSSEKPSINNIKEILVRLKINVEAANISCFFINRHDVCTLANLSNFTSKDTLNYQLDTIEVSMVDLAKSNDCFCDLSEFSKIYISTKQIKVNIDLRHDIDTDCVPQLCVDFTEKLECSWNAHFLRHLLSLVRDFRRFKYNIEDALEIVKEAGILSLPRSLPLGIDIRKLRNIRIKHANMNVDKLILLINELSGENLFFYNYFH